MILYKLEYLPVARKDMLEITKYISQDLCNPQAAEKIITTIIKKLELLTDFPYVNPIHIFIRPLEKEYRKFRVKNYTVFYYVDEYSKTIVVARVVYSKRDFDNTIK